MSPLAVFALIVAMTSQAADLREGTYRGRPAWILSNGRIELTVLARGGAFARIVLREDPDGINPLWRPAIPAKPDLIDKV